MHARIVKAVGVRVASLVWMGLLLAFAAMVGTPPPIVWGKATLGAGHGGQKFKPCGALEDFCYCG